MWESEWPFPSWRTPDGGASGLGSNALLPFPGVRERRRIRQVRPTPSARLSIPFKYPAAPRGGIPQGQRA